MEGGDSSDDNDEADEGADEKSRIRRADKLLKKKNFVEAKAIYSDILSKNGVADGCRTTNSDSPNFSIKDKYRIVMCSLNKAKCHLRLSEYNETISTISRCIGIMKEGSKYNKVHVYQRLAAAYLMRMEYRASLLVCIYGLTQFSNDEKLLAIQSYIITR